MELHDALNRMIAKCNAVAWKIALSGIEELTASLTIHLPVRHAYAMYLLSKERKKT